MANRDTHYRQTPVDYAAAGLVLAYAAAVAMFALRNNDVWWMLGIGRYILETRSFIYEDPFTFTLAGSPWSPQAYISAIIFYMVHGAAGVNGLIVLRALLVVAVFGVSLRTLARVGISWAMTAPLTIGVILIAHTRFIMRAHLFEYVFVAIMLGFLLTSHTRKGRSFFVVPAVVQVLWTNMHPSFLLGPVLVALFFAGEWLSERMSRSVSVVKPLYRHDWRRAWILLGIVAAACLVSPNPAAFLLQPLGGEQRELLSRFTLEWKSPFDPAIAAGNFHPYYEMLLGLSVLSVLLCIKRLSLAAVALLAATAYLSTTSHRFRVEFALVALVIVPVMLKGAPPIAAIVSKFGRARASGVLRIALVLVAIAMIVLTARDRVDVDMRVKARFPDRALEFVIENDVARRPFHTIGYGSYMVWQAYGQRRTFIDGRNFDAGLYREFLAAQSSRAGLEQVIAKRELDAFIIPAPSLSDGGMRNIHKNLREIGGWSLVHFDDRAFVYVNDARVPAGFLSSHAYRVYRPDTFGRRPLSAEELDGVIAELERAVADGPGYAQPWLHLGLAHRARGHSGRAVEALEQAVRIDPDEVSAHMLLASLYIEGENFAEALERVQSVLAVDPGNKKALGMRGQLNQALGR